MIFIVLTNGVDGKELHTKKELVIKQNRKITRREITLLKKEKESTSNYAILIKSIPPA